MTFAVLKRLFVKTEFNIFSKKCKRIKVEDVQNNMKGGEKCKQLWLSKYQKLFFVS